MSTTDHDAPNYSVFSSPLLPRLSKAQYFLAPYYQTPSVYIAPLMCATKFDTHVKQ